MIKFFATILLLGSFVFPARADTCGPNTIDILHSDPVTMAKAWLPLLKRLYEAVPSLSPKEEKWLRQEIGMHGQRSIRAYDSREYAIQKAKQNTGSLLFSIRRLIVAEGQLELIRLWRFFAYTLIDSDAALYLARLVYDKILQREAVPFSWKIYSEGNANLRIPILVARTQLARHILICTLPKISGVSALDN